MTRRDCLTGAAAAAVAALPFPAHARLLIDVRSLGARGDGVTLDTDPINRAIAGAARGGGGTVVVPAGRFLCFSIRLMSGVTLMLGQGAVIEAADPARHAGRYDDPENGGEQLFQDFGHSHWHNSLIWGDGLTDVAIVGPGRIEGTGLTRNGPGSRWGRQAGERPMTMRGMSNADVARLEPDEAAMRGIGNKAIALRDCSRVRIADLTIHKGGHFAILLTGCRNVALERLAIDTERDGIDLDGVQDARVEDCRVNTPNDDAIVVKSSYALGRLFRSQDVVIRNCAVSGFDLGTMLDGTRGTTMQLAPDRDRATGRIKLGTESNGGYARVLIERCRFDHSRGLALETVDGGGRRSARRSVRW
jgi:polygalacturonase